MRFLGNLFESEISRLVNRLQKATTKKERIDAIIALGNTHDTRAVAPLANCLTSSQARVREAVATALGEIGGKDAIGLLTALLQDQDAHNIVGQAAADALRELLPGGTQAVNALKLKSQVQTVLAMSDVKKKADALVRSLNDGQLLAAEQMLQAGLDPNVPIDDQVGMTPICYSACNRWSLEAVRLLLRYGADPAIKDNRGNAAFHYAAEESTGQLLEVFREHDAYSTSRNSAGEMAEEILRRLRSKRDAEERSPWQKCPTCRGHGGYGGLSEPFVRCSRCDGSGQVLKENSVQKGETGRAAAALTPSAVFSVTTDETSCRIDCHDFDSAPICSLLKSLGFTFGARYDYAEHNVVKKVGKFYDVGYESQVVEFWKCPLSFRGNDVGYAAFGENSSVEVRTIGTIEITGHQLSKDAAANLVEELVNSIHLLEKQLNDK